MTTLQAISYTFAVGCGTTAISLGLFGLAVRSRSPYIAPRCTARPKNTIYNPAALQGPQARGSPMMGWISWCNSLSYDTLLKGVPGTGTRNGGLSGMPLKVNMDGIVLLRFQGEFFLSENCVSRRPMGCIFNVEEAGAMVLLVVN